MIRWLFDAARWRSRTLEQLLALATGDRPRSWRGALRELQRRGADVKPCFATIAGYLVDESSTVREAARATLRDFSPDVKQALRDARYKSTDAPVISRRKLSELLGEPDVATLQDLEQRYGSKEGPNCVLALVWSWAQLIIALGFAALLTMTIFTESLPKVGRGPIGRIVHLEYAPEDFWQLFAIFGAYVWIEIRGTWTRVGFKPFSTRDWVMVAIVLVVLRVVKMIALGVI